MDFLGDESCLHVIEEVMKIDRQTDFHFNFRLINEKFPKTFLASSETFDKRIINDVVQNMRKREKIINLLDFAFFLCRHFSKRISISVLERSGYKRRIVLGLDAEN